MLGNIALMSKIEVAVLIYPGVPLALLMLVTVILSVTTLTLETTHVTAIWPFMLAAALVGALDGSMFTSFLFLAVSKTDLPCDMCLHFRERELVVNLLLIFRTLAKFSGFLAAYFYFECTDPQFIKSIRI